MATGTAGAQAIGLCFAPVITRLYGPEAFGLLGVFLAVLAVVNPVSAWTYPVAIVLPQSDGEARGLVRLAARVALGMSLLVAATLALGGRRLLGWVGAEALVPWAWMLPFSMLASACIQIAEQWLIRKKQFQTTARIAVVQALALNSAKAGAGCWNPAAGTLVSLSLLGDALYAALLSWGAWRAPRGGSPSTASSAGPSWSLLIRRYADFPLFRAPQVFLNALSQSLPVILLAAFFGPVSAGYYALCRRVLGMPSQLMGKSVGDVFYPRLAEAAHRGENLSRLMLKATAVLLALGGPPFLLVMALGPWLFGWVFGQEWAPAGAYARWLALWLLAMLLNGPSIKAAPVLKAQGFLLVYSVVTLGLRILALLAGFYGCHSSLVAVALFGVVGAATNILLIGMMVLKARRFNGRPGEGT